MAHTHTFEIETTSLGKVQGEMSFNGANNQPPKVSVTSPLNATLDEYKEVGVLLKEAVNLYKCAGEIQKIEIVKKP